MQCLFDAGCQGAAIINPPGRHRSWLIKAVVPDENSLGVVAIHAGTRVLYLNRVQNKKRRSPEVVSVIRSAYQAQCTQVTKPEAEKQRQELARERSRSPSKDAAKDKPKEKEKEKSKEAGPFGPFMDKVTSLDTGGGGNCGYTCLAAALALDKGESIEQVKGDLPAREEKDKPMAFGTPRSGREPIVLLLNDRQGHYTLLQLKAGRQWPKEWTQAAQASVASGMPTHLVEWPSLCAKDKGAREVNRHVAYDGQAIMLQLDDMFIIGAYLPPRNSQATQTLTVLDEWIASAGALEPVVILGDFNQEPELADRWTALADGGAAKVVSLPDGTRAPTSWKECVQSFKQVPTRSLLRPEQIPQKDWDKAMVKAWQQVPMPPNTTSEEEWNTFCSAVESSYDAAHQICSGSLSHGHTANVRAKGSPMKIKELEPAIFRLKQHASCRELKARKLLGRVREANVQQAAGASVPAVLLRRIWQHPLVRGKNFVSLLDIEHWADQEIKTLVKQDRLEKLQEWRRKMRNNMSHAREWVKRDNNLPVTSVHFEGYQDNTATSSNQQSLEAISQFWKTIWERDRPPVQEAFQFWQEGSEPMPEYAWSNLTPKELHRQAIRMKGSAGGADGITGSEAAQLPLREPQLADGYLLGSIQQPVVVSTGKESPEQWTCCFKNLKKVRTSLPQGDATSPLTLLALMTGITKIVLRREPQLFSLATFLDDRNMIARDPQQGFRLWQTWQEVSSRLGLWENDSKARVVPRRAAYEAQLVAQGFAQHHVTNAARVLGIDFTTRLGASDRKTSEERLRVTKSRLQRIAVLPVGMHLKAQHVASIAIPKAAWGCWTNLYGNVLANGLAAPPEAHGLALSEAGWKTWVGSKKAHFIGAAMHLEQIKQCLPIWGKCAKSFLTNDTEELPKGFFLVAVDAAILTHLGCVRERVLDRRYRSIVNVQGNPSAFAAVTEVEAGCSPGDITSLEAIPQHVQKVFATDLAFAAVLKDGGAVTWGCALHGGDSATVQRLLTGVQHIVCTESAFAAITADEKVITWGNPECGGDSGTLQLHHVKHVQSTKAAFAALLGDGTVVAWGFSIYGGNTEPIAH
ncbi:unnamed protein product, partial [Cladocopium goreaui]